MTASRSCAGAGADVGAGGTGRACALESVAATSSASRARTTSSGRRRDALLEIGALFAYLQVGEDRERQRTIERSYQRAERDTHHLRERRNHREITASKNPGEEPCHRGADKIQHQQDDESDGVDDTQATEVSSREPPATREARCRS